MSIIFTLYLTLYFLSLLLYSAARFSAVAAAYWEPWVEPVREFLMWLYRTLGTNSQ